MILLDVDGVILDFNSAAHRACGRAPEEPTCWNYFLKWDPPMTESEYWGCIHEKGDHFYAEMVQPYPWAEQLVDAVRNTDEFVFCSASSNSPYGYSGKKIALDKFFGPLNTSELIICKNKYLLAKKDRLLIDDNNGNCWAFRRHGGVSCIFPQPWNAARSRTASRKHHIEGILNQWSFSLERYYGPGI